MIHNFREREQARHAEREQFERQMRHRFWLGLTIPATICALTALIVGPDTWLGWVLILAELPAAAAGVAIAFMLQDRAATRR